MFVLAHLSDPHLPTPRGAPFAAYANKRVLGGLSWRWRRSRVHRPEVLAALEADLARIRPDHIAVTGDVVNVSLPDEFACGARWLAGLGAPADVTVVPGNHDAYVAIPFAQSLALWAPWLAGDTEPAGTFPFRRRRGEVVIIGLSTAQPSAAGMAWGALGPVQRAHLAEMLDRLGGEGCFRVVLIHHPPLPDGVPVHKRLRDAGAFAELIATRGAELILHGHSHRLDLGALPGPAGPVPVIGVASASVLPGHGRLGAQYHLYRIDRGADGWRLDAVRRCYEPERGTFSQSSLFPSPSAPPAPAAPAVASSIGAAGR